MTDKARNGKQAIADLYPLTPLQQGMWFHELMDPSAGTYFVSKATLIEGPLNRDVLRRAWEVAVARHAILRTRIVWEGLENPLQLVQRTVELPWAEEDWRGIPADEHEARLQEFLDADRARGLDLAQAPLMRLTLLRVADHSTIMVLSFHHVILDRWSLHLVLRELWSAYESLAEARVPRFRSLRPYRDYLAWLQGQDLGRAEHFWRQLLNGFTAPNVLGIDRAPGAEHKELSFESEGVTLSETKTTQLSQWARQHQLTVNTVVQGAWSLLLSRYCGTEDVVFGATASGRSAGLSGIESMVGLFINTLPVRARVSPDATLHEWLKGLQDQQATSREYEYSRLFEIQKWSEVAAGKPLFDTLVVFENTPLENEQGLTSEATGLDFRPMPGRGGDETNYPLALIVTPGRTLHLSFTYDTRHFTAAAVARMVGHLRQALAGMVEGSGQQRLGAIPLLTEAERRQLLLGWNDTDRSYPPGETLASLFEGQVRRSPDRVALVFEGEELTYAELNRRANRLAHHLRNLGVGPEVLVGVFMERSIEMVVSLYATLKAGGAYLPVDPEYPVDRIAFMLEDSRPAIVLTQAGLRGKLTDAQPVLVLDGDMDFLVGGDESDPGPAAGPESLAYVIYTSGSTGRPKGVMNAHQGIVNRLQWMQDAYGLDDGDWVLQKTPFSFDVSVWEFFWPLQVGAGLVVARPGGHRDNAYLIDLIRAHGVTTLHFVPSMLQLWIEEPGVGECSCLKRVICSGEALPYDLQERFFERVDAELENLYGPTEAAVDVTHWHCDPDSPLEIVPIGRPVANTQIYILDKNLEPVPEGVVGELHIGGVQVARGYLNRPELTRERFIPDPFRERPDARLYKTGDLARHLADGTIQYLGRVDHQVKVRGFRIELGEIEVSLSQLPEIREAVVVVREDEPGDPRIVAYVVPTEGTLSPGDLRRALKLRLPDYMVPGHYVILDALPLTPNGKVDRKALPDPALSREDLAEDFLPPRNPVEEALAKIWGEVLQIERIGVHDNFFDLGGHSLLAVRIVTRLKTAFTVDIPLRIVFDSPTIAGLSAAIASARRGGESEGHGEIARVSRDDRLPLSFAQERFWLLDQIHTDRSVSNVTFGFRMRGPFRLEVFRKSVQALVDRHEILRTSIASADGEPFQVIAARLSVEVPLEVRAGVPEAERAEVIRQASSEGRRCEFDLSDAPLFRIRLLQFEEDDHCVLLTIHHIINDAWSLEVIIRDLVAAYSAGSKGGETALPALPVQYVDYAQWQRELVDGPAGQEQLAYWKNQLSNLPPALPLPTDFARPAEQTFRGTLDHHQLPTELVAALRSLNREEGTTHFMVLLAALKFLLHRLSGTDDIILGSPIAGRDREELQGMIGCFLNTLVLRTKFSAGLTGRDLLKRVREVVLSAYENQDVPFERVLMEVDPVRDPSRSPIFQVMLNMHSFEDHTLPLPELSVSRAPVKHDKSLFDLTVYFAESDEGIVVSLAYNTDLFATDRMRDFLHQFQRVLEQLVDDPDQPIDEYSLLTHTARELIPDPGVELAAPPQARVPDLVARWARTDPDSVAVRKGSQQWTYADLVARAEQLSRWLSEKDVAAGTVVALTGSPSFGVVAGMLGVFRSGGILMTIDPALPGARKALMLREANARVLLAANDDDTDLSWAQSETLVRVEFSPATGEIEPGDIPALSSSQARPSHTEGDAAYVFFTSGTTGRPKGIVGSHQGLSHFLAWQRDAFEISPADRAAQLTGLSFDVVLRDVFLPLISGGVLCIPDEPDRLDGQRILRWLDRERITLLHSVPAVVAAWLATVPAGISLSDLRCVFFAGEPLTDQLVRKWRAAFPGTAKLANLYGPTETTLAKSCYLVPEQPSHGVQPIGRPLPGAQLLIMSGERLLCGIGELGEIVVRTPFRTLGPLPGQARPESFFRRNPFCPDAEEDLYFTGDLGRYRPDGTVEILGRIDEQVKIRGVRIEPNEVMNAIATHPSVHDCFVMARKDVTDSLALVAYVIPTAEVSPAASDLRTHLARQLPPAMVPSGYVFLEAFPYTPNGKIDRKALPLPDAAGENHNVEFIAPSTSAERAIGAIWQDVLKLERVGIHDNFFDLGGHSLLATQVVARMRDSLGIDLRLRHLFEVPVLKELAGLVEILKESTQERGGSAPHTDEDRSEFVL